MDNVELVNEIDKLLAAMQKNDASDLHLKSGSKPIMRIAGHPHDVGTRTLGADDIKLLIKPMLTDRLQAHMEEHGGADLAYSVSGIGRFRVNIFRQRGAVSIAIRRVNTVIPTIEKLNLPPSVLNFAKKPSGLIVVAGVTGSGKSTTLAAMIEWINVNERVHIVTVEDPIEYMFRDKKAFINQREVGIDVDTFPNALRAVLRQDPDVILCGEMRDWETLQFALTAAETGHLVFGTLHANTSAQCISRIMDLFPPDKQDGVRQSLVFNLRGIMCQRLLPSIKQGVDRVPAVEIMFVNSTIQELIKDRKELKISDVIRASAEDGMLDFNQCLVTLVKTGYISKKTAMSYTDNPDQLNMNLKGIFLDQDRSIV